MSFLRRSRRADDDADRWIVAGLGNPGERYSRTRHNAGYMTVDVLLERISTSLKRHKSGCLVAEASISDSRVVLARSISFMNETGRAVRSLMSWYKAPPERLIVVHDELDIPFGEVRVKVDGGTAGHNGLSSVSAHLGTKRFVRVRIGVSRPGRVDAADYVLKEFSAAERKQLPEVIESAANAVERIVEVGADQAMNEFNTRKTGFSVPTDPSEGGR